MSYKYRILCGAPAERCVGGRLVTDQALPKLCHSSRDEAFRCYTRYLVAAGFERVGPREFKNPENGYIRVLQKRSRFGARLRVGKLGTRYMPEGRGIIT